MKLLSLIFLTVFSSTIYSQEKIHFETPPSSPEATFTQQLANGEITVTYSRPLARGRKIFGGLVPYDSLWRTGAGGATTILSSEDFIVGGKILKAGKYSLFVIPSKETWTIILNSDTALHGTFGYKKEKDVHRFIIRSIALNTFYEAFTIDLNDINAQGEGNLSLAWENTAVKIPIENLMNKNILAQINTRLINGKEENTELYYEAANFYYLTGRDLRQAAIWAEKAEKKDNANFNYSNLLQKILFDLKDYKQALAAAKRALTLAESKNMTTAINTLKKRIAELEVQ